MPVITEIGRLIIGFRGAYSAGTAYKALDAVRAANGRVYIARQPTTGNEPSASPTQWMPGGRKISDALAAEGQILSHDGTSEVAIAPGAPGAALAGDRSWQTPSGQAEGLCRQPSLPLVIPPGSTPWLRNPAAPEDGPWFGMLRSDLGPVHRPRALPLNRALPYISQSGSVRIAGTASYELTGERTDTPALRSIDCFSAAHGPLPDGDEILYLTQDQNTLYALTKQGYIWAKGRNSQSQWPDGTSTHAPWARHPHLGPNCTVDGLSCEVAGLQVTQNSGNSTSYYTTVYAIDIHGRVFGWGYNGHGQVGQGNTTSPISTPSLIPFPEAIVQISTGTFFSLFVGVSGQLYSLGNNAHGNLGTGNTTNQLTPYAVPGMTDIYEVIALGNDSYWRSLALKTDGTLWFAGYNGLQDAPIGSSASAVHIFTQCHAPPLSHCIYSGDAYGSSFAGIGGTPGNPDGKLWVAGRNTLRQLSVGDTATRSQFLRPLTDSYSSHEVGCVDGVVTKTPIPFPRDEIAAIFPKSRSTGAYDGFYCLDNQGRLWESGYAMLGIHGSSGETLPSFALVGSPWATPGAEPAIADIAAWGDSGSNYPVRVLLDTWGDIWVNYLNAEYQGGIVDSGTPHGFLSVGSLM
jgi:alpha-tubulin suppressor-like RCC1 family protein